MKRPFNLFTSIKQTSACDTGLNCISSLIHHHGHDLYFFAVHVHATVIQSGSVLLVWHIKHSEQWCRKMSMVWDGEGGCNACRQCSVVSTPNKRDHIVMEIEHWGQCSAVYVAIRNK